MTTKHGSPAFFIGGLRWHGAGHCDTSRNTCRRAPLAAAATVLAGLSAAAVPAHADVLSEMESFWRGAAVNTTGPTAFDGQASGHWTLGNPLSPGAGALGEHRHRQPAQFPLRLRRHRRFRRRLLLHRLRPAHRLRPRGGPDAAGFAFELALETISPVIAETMSKLRALAQWVNNQNLNSCETAQALVGAAWSRNDRASAAICAAIGTSQGIFSDYAAARHGCGSDGKRNSTLAAASGPMEEQVPVNVNYAWRAVRASSFLSADTELAEFAMSVSGTVIVTAPVVEGQRQWILLFVTVWAR